MSRFGALLRAANNLKLLAAIGRSGGDLNSIADLLDNMIDSPQMVDSIRRLRRWLVERKCSSSAIRRCSPTSSG
ncbi:MULTISPECIES: hypothetical protein [unclassified Cyanobium]|uniref:hypothetical protein n=1 Tax=unclassified Cyanobium TaxID=2627006 RepID=UPI0028F42EDC|nr:MULTISPECIES: hypothetical protein [unclassified Cyanobium]